MSVLTVLPPTFSPEKVEAIVRDLYGIGGKFTPLDSERDQNFRLQEPSGQGWVVKIANQAEDLEALEFQAALLNQLLMQPQEAS